MKKLYYTLGVALALWFAREVYQLRVDVSEMRVDLQHLVKQHEAKTASR